MIAKLIVWGADREQALARDAARRWREYQIVGVATNVDFLRRLSPIRPSPKPTSTPG